VALTSRSRGALTASRKFGLGPLPGESSDIGDDARGWLAAQCERPDGAAIDPGGLPVGPEALRLQREYLDTRVMPALSFASPGDGAQASDEPRSPARIVYDAEAALRLERAASTAEPFLERLVMFWSNHFTVSVLKNGQVRATAGAFEREAIRPHVLGSFRDMLGAVCRHPAMLLYLDNFLSVGPRSRRAAEQRGLGLNENFGRELLELHTIGVDGGYAQKDVTELALILTGWGVKYHDEPDSGTFAFYPNRHEPGIRHLLGKPLADGEIEQGDEALDRLVAHPSCARYIATRLVQHFVTDHPPPALIDRIATVFRDTGGDLRSVSRALVTDDLAWSEAEERFLPPYDFLVAAHRALQAQPKPTQVVVAARSLGQEIWGAPSPKGWPDAGDAWSAPSALVERLDWAGDFAAGLERGRNIDDLVSQLFDPADDREFEAAVGSAGTQDQALALLLMSPRFQRR